MSIKILNTKGKNKVMPVYKMKTKKYFMQVAQQNSFFTFCALLKFTKCKQRNSLTAVLANIKHNLKCANQKESKMAVNKLCEIDHKAENELCHFHKKFYFISKQNCLGYEIYVAMW